MSFGSYVLYGLGKSKLWKILTVIISCHTRTEKDEMINARAMIASPEGA